MKKKDFIMMVSMFVIFITLFVIGTVNAHDRIQSIGFSGIGTSIGFLIGSLIRIRKKIINPQRCKRDLYLLLTFALIGSFLMALLLDDIEDKAVSVIAYNLVLITIFFVRNAKNIVPEKPEQ